MSENMYNFNIERAVLSAIIFDPQIFEDIAAKLKPHDFYLPFHQHIFSAMEDLSREDKPIDEEFIRSKLRSSGNFDEVAMLDVLAANPITNTDAYLEEIKARASKRALATLATTIKKVTIEDDLPVEEVMNLVEKKLYEITQNNTNQDFRDSKEITLAMLDEINRLKALGNSKLIGIDTGFRNLNDKTSGFGKGDLVIIAARPAMGKTALILNISFKAIKRSEGVAFFSLEMPAEQLMLRLLSTETSIPLQKLRVGDLTDEEWNRLSRATNDMSRRKLFVDDGGHATIHQVRSKLRKLKSQHPEITMAVIDYLQLMSGEGKEGRQQEISEISRGLKQLARELQIPIIALSQLNRSLESRENKRPMLSDLRESGCLAGDSIIVDVKSGKQYTIESLVENKHLLPLQTKAMDGELKVHDFAITNAFFSGVKQTYKLMTRSGKTIRATANHKFYRLDGWVRLDCLSVGDKIATPERMEIEITQEQLCDDELIILAHLLGDGSILEGQPYHYTNEEQKKRNDKVVVYYATSSYALATQVHSLLLRVGIVATLNEVKQQKGEKLYRPNYHIRIQNKEALERLLRDIGSFGQRGEKAESYLNHLANISTNLNSGCIDKSVWQTYIKAAKEKEGISWRLFCDKLNTAYCGSTLFKSGVSKERMMRMSEFLKDKKIKHLAHSTIYWDEILSIEADEEVKTYDLTVDGVHNFVANDIIVHNSIEQDADIVMFVYRDDVYREAQEKEKEMKAKAEGKEYKSEYKRKEEEETELIIGKQRNGPTGTVELIFQKRFTRFVDTPFEVIYEDKNINTSTQANINMPMI